MKKIDNLLQNEHVEWKKLGEVCEILNGYSFKSESYSFSGIRVIRISDVQNGFISNKELKYYSSNNIKEIERYLLYEDDLVISLTGNVGRVALIDKSILPAALNQRVACIRCPNQITSKYLFHFLNQNLFEKMAIQNSSGGGQKNLSTIWLNNYEIPIPSLKTQEKIVKTLDKFTNCVTELQAELQARNKQYNYYRDKLLSEEYLGKISKKIDKLENKKYQLRSTTLGDVGEFTRGNGLQKSDFTYKGKPAIHYGQIYTKYGFSTDKTISYVSDATYSKLRKAKTNDILIATTSENIEDVGKSTVWLGKEEIGFSGDMYSYSTNENSKYIAYYFQTEEFHKQKARKISGTKLIRIHGDDMKKFCITLPSLEIQEKIVEILDKFQSMLSDTQGLLPKEIEQRKKQYEYYREKLLTFNTICDSKQASKIIPTNYFTILKEAANIVDVELYAVKWKSLGEIGKFENGTGMPKTMFSMSETIGAIHYGHIYTKYNMFVYNPIVNVSTENAKKLKKVNQGDLVIAKTSENVEDIMKTVAYLGEGQVVTGGHAAIFSHQENPKYLSYVFNGASYLISQKNKLAKGVKVIELSISDMEKIKIPLPSLPVQEYIVSILDKFDMLVNDISQGLPKEIELRKKQYEYYREKLFSFNK